MALLILRLIVVSTIATALEYKATVTDDENVNGWLKTVWCKRHDKLYCELPDTYKYNNIIKSNGGERKVPPHFNLLHPSSESQTASTQDRIVWTFNGEDISQRRVADDGALILKGRHFNEGTYTCKFISGDSNIIIRGRDILLQFVSMANNFTENPENTVVAVGQSALLRCGITSKPAANITWTNNSQPIDLSNERLFVDVKGELLITNVNFNDEGNYRCVASNSFMQNKKVRWSTEASLKVIEVKPKSLYKESVSFLETIIESNHVVKEGDNLTLACGIKSNSSVEVAWDFINEKNEKSRMATGQIARFLNLKLNDTGTYSCNVVEFPNVSKEFQIEVTRAPRLILRPNSTTTQQAGKARFNCTAEGVPEPTIIWFKDGNLLNIEGNVRNVNSSDTIPVPQLLVSGASSSDAGTYQCVAINKAGGVSDWAVLGVQRSNPGPPPPKSLICYPLGPDKVKLLWQMQDDAGIIAYTVQFIKKKGTPEETQLSQDPFVVIKDLEPYRTYNFTVRSYVKQGAGPYSPYTSCSGQGVPLTIVKEDGVMKIRWEKLNVTSYRLQGRRNKGKITMDVKLKGHITEYNLTDISSNDDFEIRLLANADNKWPKMVLDYLPWISVKNSLKSINNARSSCEVPTNFKVVNVEAKSANFTWTCPGADLFELCYSIVHPLQHDIDRCLTSNREWIQPTLTPETEYIVRVRVHNKPGFTVPINVQTIKAEDEDQVKNVKILWDGNDLLISWTPANTTDVETNRHATSSENDQTGDDLDDDMSKVEAQNVNDNYYSVLYSQNLTLPLSNWSVVVTNSTVVRVSGLEPRLTYAVVTRGVTGQHRATVYHGTPTTTISWNLTYYIAGALCALGALLCLIAVIIWSWRRKRKTATMLPTMRQSDLIANDTLDNWDHIDSNKRTRVASKNGSTCNNRNVREPLLNGHVERNQRVNGSPFSNVLDLSRGHNITATTILPSTPPRSVTKHRDDNMNCHAQVTAVK